MKSKVTLGRLAREVGLARASLLHYESLGLLTPSERTQAGYRLYGQDEIDRLQLIRRYRDAGLSLSAIRELCGTNSRNRSEPATLLEERLLDTSHEIEQLRTQQRMLARLLASRQFRNVQRCRDKNAWSNLLQRAGFTHEEMRSWHRWFEAEAPADHGAFLKSLGLALDEVRAIRRWSANGKGKT
jgi:MerR family transcriptional regulator, thiopeptide resistance regulator